MKFRSVWGLSEYLKKVAKDHGKQLAEDIAAAAAPIISEMARETFAESKTPYGVPWAPAVDGSRVGLVKDGELKKGIHYKAFGTKLRCVLGPKYAIYQIGKRPVYPRNGGKLPKEYNDRLSELAARMIEERAR